MTMEDPDAVLTALQGYLSTGRTSLTGGNALAGISAAGDYDDLAFALPANAAAGYCKRKKAAVTELMGEATQVWEAE